MSLYTLIIIVTTIVVALIFILFPEARSLLSGFARLFIKDMATTPEGAEAIYEEKINEAREAYNKADNSYKFAAGKLKIASNRLEVLLSRLESVENECEALVKSGKMESAQLKAEEREEILSDIARQKELVKAYTEAAKNAEEVHEHCEKTLRKLKRESKEVVENMKVKKQLKDVYDGIDDLKNATGTDKMIESIREKSKDLDSIVEGSRVVHNSKLSTRISKAESEAKKAQRNDYLENLKKKYNK